MHRMLRTTILITFGMLIICIISGCSDNPPEEVTDPPQPEDDVPPPSAVTVVVDPAPPENPNLGFLTNTEFTLRFSQEVVAVTVNGIPAMGSGLNWKWASYLHLSLGPGQFLDIQWTDQDGSTGTKKIGPYNFTDNISVQPPSIMSGTVSYGDVDVDPRPINAGGLRFDFDEPVTGTIKLIPFLKFYIALAVLIKYEKAVILAIAALVKVPRISLNCCCIWSNV